MSEHSIVQITLNSSEGKATTRDYVRPQHHYPLLDEPIPCLTNKQQVREHSYSTEKKSVLNNICSLIQPTK